MLTSTICSADEYYIGQWEWAENCIGSEGCWRAPHFEDNTGSIDLRSIPNQSVKGGTPQGFGVFTYSTTVVDNNLVYLGSGKDGVISTLKRTAIQNKIGKTIIGSNIKDVIYEFLTTHADATGENFAKPLMPDKDLKMKINIGTEGEIKQTMLVPGMSEEWPKVLAVIQNDYRRMIETEPQILMAKWLDSLEDQYNLPYTTFIPKDAPIKIVSLPHETTITEDFNCTDSDSLNCDLTWTELVGDIDLVSNTAQIPGGFANALARADSDVSSTNFYVQSEIQAAAEATTSNYIQIGMRKDSSATLTFYHYGTSFLEDTLNFYKCVSGSFTQLVTDAAQTLNISTTYTLKIKADGSTITWDFNGSQVASTTDTAITTGTRGQIRGTPAGGGAAIWDNWSASDLAGRRTWILN